MCPGATMCLFTLRLFHNSPTASQHNTQSQYSLTGGHHCTVLTCQDKHIHTCVFVIKSCVLLAHMILPHTYTHVCSESAQCNIVYRARPSLPRVILLSHALNYKRMWRGGRKGLAEIRFFFLFITPNYYAIL